MPEETTPGGKRRYLSLAENLKLSEWMKANRAELEPLTRSQIAEKATAHLGTEVSPASITGHREALEWPARAKASDENQLELRLDALAAVVARLVPLADPLGGLIAPELLEAAGIGKGVGA